MEPSFQYKRVIKNEEFDIKKQRTPCLLFIDRFNSSKHLQQFILIHIILIKKEEEKEGKSIKFTTFRNTRKTTKYFEKLTSTT